MSSIFRSEPSNAVVDQAANVADHAIRSTQQVANNTLDGMAEGVQDLRHQATPLLNRAAEQANALAQRGAEAVRETSQQLRDKAQQASDSTVTYIRDEPVKSMLIAAATGAALMGLLGLMSRSHHRG